MNKTLKILMVVLMVAIIAVIPTVAMATSEASATQTISNLFTKSANGTSGIVNVGGRIVNIITTIGIVVAVVVLLVLGIKYMMGSAAEKAEYKKTMIPYLVGALLIFGASAIAKAVVSVTASLTAA